MPSDAKFLGIDCGTQSTKTLLIDRNGSTRGRGSAPHELIERPSGAREQEPAWWIEALRKATKQALADAPASTVRAIGVSGQQHGLVILDEEHRVIRPAKLWNDTETAAQNKALIERLGGRTDFFHRFGILPLTGYTVSKLLWIAENEPANFKRIRHILLPHEYLNFWLTGVIAAEYGDASGTAFFDVRSRAWIPEILDEIDGGTGQLSRALPPLVGHDEIIGTIRPDVAAEFGLAPDCVVSAGGGDNMMGAIGTGNVQEGIVTLSLGTSSTVYSFRNEPPQDATGCVAPFCSSSGGWLPLVCTMNATNVVTQTATLLGRTVEEIDAALGSTSPGADGLTFIPFLNGERTPDLPEAQGSISGVSSTNLTADNLLRAAIEGVSFGILNGLDRILPNRDVRRLRVIGGGSRSSAWRQLLADTTGALIEVPSEPESGCLGAAMQAMYASSQISDSPESLSAIAARCVKIAQEATAAPNSATRELYVLARNRYKAELERLYDQVASLPNAECA